MLCAGSAVRSAVSAAGHNAAKGLSALAPKSQHLHESSDAASAAAETTDTRAASEARELRTTGAVHTPAGPLLPLLALGLQGNPYLLSSTASRALAAAGAAVLVAAAAAAVSAGMAAAVATAVGTAAVIAAAAVVAAAFVGEQQQGTLVASIDEQGVMSGWLGRGDKLSSTSVPQNTGQGHRVTSTPAPGYAAAPAGPTVPEGGDDSSTKSGTQAPTQEAVPEVVTSHPVVVEDDTSSGDDTAVVDATAPPPLADQAAEKSNPRTPAPEGVATEDAAAAAAAASLGDHHQGAPDPAAVRVTLVSHVGSLFAASAEAAAVVYAAAADSWAALQQAWKGPGDPAAARAVSDGDSVDRRPAGSATRSVQSHVHHASAWLTGHVVEAFSGRKERHQHGKEDGNQQEVSEVSQRTVRVLTLALQPVLLVAAAGLASLDTAVWRARRVWSAGLGKQQPLPRC
jgi:hypothetical protein